MNADRFVLSDAVWLKIEPYLPGKSTDSGVTALDNRLSVEAVLWRVRTGSPWRDLPRSFENWNSTFRRCQFRTKTVSEPAGYSPTVGPERALARVLST